MKSRNKNKKLRIGLIYGGQSPEHEVSLHTGEQIKRFLNPNKYRVIPIKISRTGQWPRRVSLGDLNKKIDLAFIALHGSYGEDGTIQGLMEMLHIPYTFSGVLASSLAIDKMRTQLLAERTGILMPEAMLITAAELEHDSKRLLARIKKLGAQIVLKPKASGSSVGVEIIKRSAVRSSVLRQALLQHGELVAQQYITGKEITAPVLGNEQPQALPLIEIVPATTQQFYDYKAKYSAGGSEHLIPAPLPLKLTQRIQQTAVAMHQLLGCRGVSRSDFILSTDKQVYFLETNTIPGMTQTSLLPQSAEAAGLPFDKLLDKIIQLALN